MILTEKEKNSLGVKVSGYIYETREWNDFNQLSWNRLINMPFVNKLVAALKQGAEFSPADCFWDGRKLWIIDGQNRSYALSSYGLPIRFVLVDKKPTILDLAQRQCLRKPWTSGDFLAAYVDWGFEGYMKFGKFITQNSISIDFGLILMHQGAGRKNEDWTPFQRGELNDKFKETDFRVYISFIKQIKDLVPKFPTSISSRAFLRAAFQLINDYHYNHSSMMEQTEQCANMIHGISGCDRDQEWLDLLVDVYNHGRADGKVSPRIHVERC